jgi:RNA polymerase sigma-70 factor (ECF subfamily)
MLNLSDAELVKRLQKGDTEAVGVLLEQYANRLYNYAFYRCSDHYLAEDIVSETFARIVEKINSYEQREVPFKAWVFRIAHNRLANHLRYRSRHYSVSLDAVNEDGERLLDPPDDWGAADGGLMASHIAEREELRHAIMALSEDQKAVFVLRFIEGLNLEEVATSLEKSIASIKSLQYRAVVNLRRTLEQAKEIEAAKTSLSKKLMPFSSRGKGL